MVHKFCKIKTNQEHLWRKLFEKVNHKLLQLQLRKEKKKKRFLPSIIFSIEQEVCTHYGHTDGHNGKD